MKEKNPDFNCFVKIFKILPRSSEFYQDLKIFAQNVNFSQNFQKNFHIFIILLRLLTFCPNIQKCPHIYIILFIFSEYIQKNYNFDKILRIFTRFSDILPAFFNFFWIFRFFPHYQYFLFSCHMNIETF